MSVSLGKPVKSLQEYQDKQAELSAYLTGHWLTDFSNFSSFVFHSVPDLNWAGFYLFNGDKLLLGP
jgi:GAF domain-containing protein